MGCIGYTVVDGAKKYCLYDDQVPSGVSNAHPARFSPEDAFSKYRIQLKQECNDLPQ
ncbi:H/ACA ribonucleoprotein complex subunit 3 [Nematocida major]|uniref:H/ACA ribonucleoprotein complex subunit 3 n=1 Tax=Nematocida major TaxID=1912982 RepID=UPI002008A9D7|nr:H/ACA ribonucleoprotein complex subunit 3 [Nematocida major]KAH9387085.1 H/ACA ribonucleoprotein complex subunit 3 [Nematocida major]